MTNTSFKLQEQELEAAKQRALIENTAQTIFKHLQALEDKRSSIVTRWVWELLQNARDVSPQGGSLRIYISAESNRLTFRHNGTPFANEEISHLIYHGSTKQVGSESDSIGHFGSGFISTHLISKQIHISGHMTSGNRFRFCLNREAASPAELSHVMDRSWEEFKTSLASVGESAGEDYTTEYVYPLTPETIGVVEAGISSLQSCAPYVLVFNHALTSINVRINDLTILIEKEPPEEIGDGIKLIKIKTSTGLPSTDQRYIVLCTEEDISVAALLLAKDGELAFSVDANLPKIFLAFPLYGTDKFGFPVALNSEFFKPNEDRDDIVLGVDESEGNLKNKLLISKACALLLKLMSVSASKGWKNSQALARLGTAAVKTGFDANWYNKLVKENLIEPIRRDQIILNTNSVPIRPLDSWIPLGIEGVGYEELWDITEELRAAAEKLPLRGESGDWQEILSNWASYYGLSPDGFAEGWTVRKLAVQVSEIGSLSHLRDVLRDDSKATVWLSKLHEIVMRAGLKGLFDDLKLLPDQHGNLRKRNELSVDSGIDEQLKDIAASMGIDIRSKMLHPEASTESIQSLLPEHRTEEQILDRILKQVKQQASVTPDSNFLSASASLFAWLIQRQRWQDLQSYPVATEDWGGGANEILFLPNRQSSELEDLPLIPVLYWPNEAQEFADLFPARFILRADSYRDVVPAEAWSKLAEQGFVRTSPLYESRRPALAFLPDEPLSDESGINHRSTTPVEQSFIAYLRKSDVGITDSARKSRSKSTRLFKFILQYVLSEDHAAFNVSEVTCECGEAHRYFRAGWLSPLKSMGWVFVGRNRSSKPTAQTLADLIQTDSELSTLLSSEYSLKFIRALGVDPAELSLRSFAKDEDSRVALIRSLADITEATGNDVDRVVALASAVKGDPELLKFVEERAKERIRIRRNQDIGRTVEQLLSSALSSKGLRVTRTGVGSDYEVETDVIEDSKEMLLQVEKGSKSYLIEIKATTGATARMTAKQAEVASQEKDRFILCMVKLDSDDCSEAAVLKGVRFITDIGIRVEPLWEVYVELQKSKAGATTSHGDLELEIYEADTRFKIGSGAWASGLKYDEAIAYFLTL